LPCLRIKSISAESGLCRRFKRGRIILPGLSQHSALRRRSCRRRSSPIVARPTAKKRRSATACACSNGHYDVQPFDPSIFGIVRRSSRPFSTACRRAKNQRRARLEDDTAVFADLRRTSGPGIRDGSLAVDVTIVSRARESDRRILCPFLKRQGISGRFRIGLRHRPWDPNTPAITRHCADWFTMRWRIRPPSRSAFPHIRGGRGRRNPSGWLTRILGILHDEYSHTRSRASTMA